MGLKSKIVALCFLATFVAVGSRYAYLSSNSVELPKDLVLLKGANSPGGSDSASLWYNSPYGLISVKEKWRAVVAYREAEAGFDKFEKHFGVRPERGLFSDGTVILEDIAYDRNLVKWTLVWPIKGSGPSEAHLNTAIRHELAHGFLRVYLWPWGSGEKVIDTPKSRYGSPAPDWLDELAAMSVEDDLKFNNRLKNFQAMARASAIIPFSDFFTMEHPNVSGETDPSAKVTVKKQLVGGKTITTTTIIRTPSGPGDFSIGTKFVEQGAALFSFLTEKTSDLQVFGKVSSWIQQGGSFEGWLEQYAVNANNKADLGSSLTEFEAKFIAWGKALKI
ncbi:MAG: hypothetical protein JKY60_15305 [Kordiimonadaceae bacterium]|nr:hypothetical protein [Kordiimonadaceae bacterium]